MGRFLFLALATCLTSTLAFAVHINGEPHLEDILSDEYPGGVTPIAPDDGVYFQNEPNQISIRVIAKYSDAFQQIGICDICDGSDNTFLDPIVMTNGVLNIQLLLGGNPLFDFASIGGFVFLSNPSNAPAAPVPVFSQPAQNPGGVDLFLAYRVNSSGRIVFAIEDWTEPDVNGQSPDFDYNDIVIEVTGISETPEPGTVVLMLSGLVGLGLLRRRMTNNG